MKTTFENMPCGVRTRWLAWANSHDWGQSQPARYETAKNGKLVMRVECAVFDPNDREALDIHYAKSPADLRAWAGY